ncbi:IQ motif and SEC7 domain-containing protein 3 [Latimeria chalumnae]|uniref:IQ motif and SEC7 domain-containing protein 3 n=1 Tax=Latimeria chalumnae TaxID=7897 RepID=UPI00313D567E
MTETLKGKGKEAEMLTVKTREEKAGWGTGCAALVQKASLHHTASPMRVQRSKGPSSCSHSLVSNYELSLDLKNKQIEMLEHKYGGHLVSRRAACTIQTAFRQYQLSKNFEKIRNSLLESRTPRRISLRKVRVQNTEGFSAEKALMEGYNFVGIPLVRSPSLPASISGALTELEDSFTEQVQSLAKSIDDALSTWSLKTMCSLQDGGTYQFTETYSSTSRQEGERGEQREASGQEKEDHQLDAIPRSGSAVMMAFRDVTVQIDNKNISVSSSVLESASVSVTNCLSNMQANLGLGAKMTGSVGEGFSELKFSQNALAPPLDTEHLQNNNGLLESSTVTDGEEAGEEGEATIQTGGPGNEAAQAKQLDSVDNSEQLSSSSTSTSVKSTSEVSPKEALQAMILSLPRYRCENPVSCKSPTLSTDVIRKRLYRIGLNLFNINPDKGIQFLISRGFIPDTPIGVAHFLLQRKGLSRQMIGEFLGNSKKQFNRDVLDCVVDEMDFSNMELDEALRKFQAHIRVQGEAQKVERLIEAFSQRYCMCNPDVVQQFHNPDTIFILAFAIVLLNTDMYSPNIKPDRKMMLEDFIRNLRGVDDGADIPREMVVGIYERIQQKELKSNEDHVTYVTKVEKSIVGMKTVLSVPHRRLVCCSRLFEVSDVNKAQKQAAHQREVFLFNDLLVILKLCPKKKSSATYSFCKSVCLLGMQFHLFESEYYSHGINIIFPVSGSEKRQMLNFCAQSSEELQKFVEDLKESIAEVTEMEQIRIEWELEKQQGTKTTSAKSNGTQLEIRPKQGSPSGKKDLEDRISDDIMEVSIHNRLQMYQHSSATGNQESGVLHNTLLNLKQDGLSLAPVMMDPKPETLVQCQQIVKVIVLDKPGQVQLEKVLAQTPTHQAFGSNASTPLRSVESGLQGTPVKLNHQPPLPPPPPPYNHPHQYCPPNPLLHRRRYSSGSRSLV